jgi:hypothetical protein
LICCGDGIEIAKFLPKPAKLSIGRKTSEAQFDHNLSNGMEMQRSHYKILNTFADRVLVGASEESRRGAGE